MKKIFINITWIAGVLLVGLLLSTCESTGAGGANGQRVTSESPPDSCAIKGEAGLTAITNEAELRAITNDSGCGYFLTKSITLIELWVPLATFTGTLDGKDNSISGLVINNQTGSNVGFFSELGADATVKNLIFDAPSVRGKATTGVLAGTSSATTVIENLQIKDGTIEGSVVGGLVGENAGVITSSYVTSTVSGSSSTVSGSTDTSYGGGLVGKNYGTIESSYVTGTVSGDSSIIGGLVGRDEGTITNSYATGTVSGILVGGLVGQDKGIIENSYATGMVSGTLASGGLVGSNEGAITNSYATGEINGFLNAGGLVGENKNQGTIKSSYYDKVSTGQSDTGKGVEVSAEANIVVDNGVYYDNGGTSGATTTEIFVDWDPAIWTFATGKWPTLAWQTP